MYVKKKTPALSAPLNNNVFDLQDKNEYANCYLLITAINRIYIVCFT